MSMSARRDSGQHKLAVLRIHLSHLERYLQVFENLGLLIGSLARTEPVAASVAVAGRPRREFRFSGTTTFSAGLAMATTERMRVGNRAIGPCDGRKSDL
jgi:hypothetical protein